jgi:hypothetical protein
MKIGLLKTLDSLEFLLKILSDMLKGKMRKNHLLLDKSFAFIEPGFFQKESQGWLSFFMYGRMTCSNYPD